jgi:hypothetical protein
MEYLPPAGLDALAQHLARARHDLGKYVAFQARWLPDGAGADELRAALLADLTRTRAAAGLVESAPEIWDRLRPALVGQAPLDDGSRVDLSGDADFLEVEAHIAVVRAALPTLPAAPRPALEEARAAALGIAAALQRLHARARALGRS